MVEEVPWCELQYAGRATQIRAGTAVDSRNLERTFLEFRSPACAAHASLRTRVRAC
jgi:hypothetical protein